MASVTVTGRDCNNDLVYNHGHVRSGEPCYRCHGCQRSFQVSYRYEAHKQGTPAKIINMVMNESGVVSETSVGY